MGGGGVGGEGWVAGGGVRERGSGERAEVRKGRRGEEESWRFGDRSDRPPGGNETRPFKGGSSARLRDGARLIGKAKTFKTKHTAEIGQGQEEVVNIW